MVRRLWPLALLTVAGGALRLATLDLQSFWYDEVATARLVSRDLGGVLDGVSSGESTPPLYYLLAWAWAQAFGTGEVGLRSLSALLGTLTIPLAYAAATTLFSRREGLALAALAALNPLLWWYSQEARAYALLALLAAASLWGFALLLRRPSRAAAWLWALSSALALATHYFAAFAVAAELVWLLVARGPRRHALLAAAAVALAGLALLPLALHQRSLDHAGFIEEEALGGRLAKLAKQFVVGFDAPLEAALASVGLALAATGGVLALARMRTRGRRRSSQGDRSGADAATESGADAVAGINGVAAAGAVALAATLGPLAGALAGVDYLNTRNLLAAWLPLACLVAAGLAWHAAGRVAIAALCALGLAGSIGVVAEPAWQRDDWRSIAGLLGEAGEPRVLVGQPPSGRLPLGYYLSGLQPLPAEGRAVRELVLLATVLHGQGIHPAPPPAAVAPAPGWTVAERHAEKDLVVIRMRAPEPVPLTEPMVGAYALEPGPGAVVVVQEPRGP